MRGIYDDLQVWRNKKGTTNLITVPVLEANEYIMSTHDHGNWVVTTPQGTDITFKCYVEICIGMLYIDLRDQAEGFIMLKAINNSMRYETQAETITTFRKNMGDFTLE